jgi:TP901 family phage tail tape measure protein
MPKPDVRVRLSAEGQKEIADAFRKIQAEGGRAGKGTQKEFAGLNSVLSSTRALLGAVGIGFGAITATRGIRTSINELREWETEWAKSRTIMSATEAEAAQIEKRVRGLANIRPQSQTLLAQGFYQTLSSGITDSADALFVLDEAAIAATAGATDVFTAVDVGTTVLNAFGGEVQDVSRIFDVLFSGVREGKFTFEEIAASIGTAIPIFAQGGFDLEQLVAGLATLTKGGIKPDEAVTALRAAIVSLLKPAEEALQTAERLGIAFDIQSVAARGLVPWLQEVAEKTEGNQEEIAKLFPNVRALTGVLALAGNQWEEYARILDVIRNKSVGVVREAFDKVNETLAAQEDLLRNRLRNAWLDLGESVRESLKSGLAGLGALLPASLEEQLDRLARLRRELARVETSGDGLIETYENLVDRSDGSAEAQREVTEAMRELAEAFPDVITRVDEYGNVIEANTARLRLFRDELRETISLQERDLFQEAAGQVARLSKELGVASLRYNSISDALDRLRRGEQLQLADVVPRVAGGPGSLRGEFVTPERVEGMLRAARVTLAQLQQELRAATIDLVRPVVDAGLAAAVLDFESLAQAVERGERPVEDLDRAVADLDNRFISLFETANPQEVRKRMLELAEAFRTVDPQLGFLPVAGPEAPGHQGSGRVEQVRKLLSDEVQAAKDAARLRLAEEQLAFDRGLRSVEEHYAARRRIIIEASDAEIAALERRRAAASEDEARAKIDQQLAKARTERERALVELIGDQERAIQDLGAEQLALEERLLEAQGRRHELALRNIETEIARADLLLRRLGAPDDLRTAELDRIRGILGAQVEFEEVGRRAELAFGSLETARRRIFDQVDAGLLSQLEAEQQLAELEKERTAQLRAFAAAMLAAARATGSPEAIASAEAFAGAIERIGLNAQTTTNLLRRFKATAIDSTERALTDFFDTGISGAENLGQAFRNMAASIAADLRRLSSQLLASQILRSLLSLAGGGGGAGGFFRPVAMAHGGLLRGEGTGTSDSNLGLFSDYEFMVRSAVVKEPGVLDHLVRLNREGGGFLRHELKSISDFQIRGYADGGLVGGGKVGSPEDIHGRVEIGLDDGLVLRALDTPAGGRLLIKVLGKVRRSARTVMGVD